MTKNIQTYQGQKFQQLRELSIVYTVMDVAQYVYAAECNISTATAAAGSSRWTTGAEGAAATTDAGPAAMASAAAME